MKEKLKALEIRNINLEQDVKDRVLNKELWEL